MKKKRKHPDYYHFLEALNNILPRFIGTCFTAGEVNYMQAALKMAMDSDNFFMEPTIYQHMYDRFSPVVPHFKEAWDALEKCKTPDEVMAVDRKYLGSARIAAMVSTVRSRSFDWREDCPTPLG